MSVTHQQKWLVLSISFPITSSCTAQLFEGKKAFTHQDTLRGTITPERAWWDVMQYSIFIKPEYSSKTISGYSQISFKTLKRGRKMQVDLQEPLIIDSVTEKRMKINYHHPFT